MKKIKLVVLTPDGKKFEEECDLVQIHGDKYFLGIMPNHAPLVSDVIVSKLIIRNEGIDSACAVGEGILSVENDIVKLMVESFEKSDEIDLERAQAAKKRAEDRLENLDETIDIARAKAALKRALNRINVTSEEV